MLPFIYKELEAGRVAAYSSFNDLPFSDVSDIQANPDKWYLRAEAREYLLLRIADAAAQTEQSVKGVLPLKAPDESSGDMVKSNAEPLEESLEESLGISGKLRRDQLDPAIEKAIVAAGTLDTAAVWNELKELALREEKPFNGSTDKGALCYTDAIDRLRTFNKDALRKRLRLRSQARRPANGG